MWSVHSFFFLIFIFTLFHFTILYWFCHTLTWIRHGCIRAPNPESLSHLPPHWSVHSYKAFSFFTVAVLNRHFTLAFFITYGSASIGQLSTSGFSTFAILWNYSKPIVQIAQPPNPNILTNILYCPHLFLMWNKWYITYVLVCISVVIGIIDKNLLV